MKAELFAHAQRIASLLVSDKEFASCRVEKRACVMWGEVQAGRREGVGQWRRNGSGVHKGKS